ncbi:MAG: MFS transporter [Sphingobacteriales bacterium JAD_PAG50586_3]|nr:MAG: MFS transporter [Sphingobacteriales bacterium JAD_PAG50586_3]
MKKQTINNGTSLSENSFLRYFTFIVLYFSQGIPEGITIFAIPAWMAMNGKTPIEIAAYSAVIMIPFSLKILLAPVMERYTYLPMGRRKPWLLFGQLGIFSSLIAMALIPNPLENISTLSAVVVCLHTFILFQDIATDSLVIDIVPIPQQGKANSLMWGSKAIGVSISLIAGSWLINNYSLSVAVITLSVLVFIIMAVALMVKERQGEKLLPGLPGKTSPQAALMAVDSWPKLFKSFKQVVFLPNTLLLLLAIYIAMISIHYVRTLLPVFTIQELKWTSQYYSNVFSISNLVGGICGMLIGGFLIQRFGVVRMIQYCLFLIATLVFSMSLCSPYWGNTHFVSAFIGLFCTLITLITIGALALAMQLCWKRISAMQFTFCMTVFNFGLSSGAALFGFIRQHFQWQTVFMLFSLLAIITMVILKYIKTQNH